MNQKKKPTAAKKPVYPIQQTSTANKSTSDAQKTDKSANDTNQVENERNYNNRKCWICKECVIGVGGLLINAVVAVIAWMVYEQTTEFFNIEKKPYLQISDIKIDSFQVGKTAIVRYKIYNLGEHPTKVIESKSTSAGRIEPMTFSALDTFKNEPNQIINRYITKDAPLEEYFEFGVVTEEMEDLMKNKGHFIGTVGFIKFQNLVTEDISTYKYIFRVYPKTFQFDLNDNK